MACVIEIKVEALTDHAFAPFGQVIGPRADAPAFGGEGLRSWALEYGCDDTTELMYIWFDHIPMTFSKVERHLNVTQAFVPLDASAMVMVVGPRTDTSRPDDAPDANRLRAFLVPGTHGVMMWRGVWHALNRFPIRPPGGGFVLVTSRETQSELEHQLHEGSEPQLTHVFDYARCDACFEVRL
jgi:ureidoglycolate hydrolase